MAKTYFVDIQFLQTEAYRRGMGRYFVAFFMAWLRQQTGDAYHCLYSSNISDENIKAFERELEALEMTNVHFRALNLHIHSFETDNYDAAFAHNKAIFTRYLSEQTAAEPVWLIPCLMQEPVVPAFPDHPKLVRTVIWYDLIPYLLYEHYFPDHHSAYAKSYLKRLNTLPRIEHIYAISEASKNDLVEFMSIPGHKITAINGSLNEQLLIDNAVDLPKTIKPPYFICPASPEPSKNVLNTIKGFGIFNKQHQGKYHLVITSRYDPALVAEAKRYARNVLFTDHVSTEEMRTIYMNSEGLLFASTYEGLGLPILEAVHFGKKVVCSSILVFQELQGGKAFYWCDPLQPESIAQALTAAMKNGPGLSKPQTQTYEHIRKEFTWAHTAQLFASSVGKLQPLPRLTKTVAIVGPHPASFSTIGKVIGETYPYFAEVANVHFYYDSGPSDKRHGLVHFHYLQEYEHFYPVSQLVKNLNQYERVIYHMGSSDHHMKSYLIAHAHPGTVILHDSHLAGKGLSAQMLSNGYLSQERLDLELKLETDYLQQPERFITSLVSSQKRMVAHSRFTQQVIKNYQIGKTVPVTKTNLPIHTLQYPEKFSENGPIRLGIVGILAAAKGTDIIEWILQETDGLKGCELSVFGFGFFANKPHLLELAQQYPNLKVAFDLSDLEYKRLLSELDVLVNYRAVYHGETSRATLEAMRERVVPIVRNIGWFGELPDEAAIKLNQIEELPDILRAFGDQPAKAREELSTMVEAGQKLLKEKFNFEQYVHTLMGDV